ncbi:hypothetical protein AB4Z34_05265 [Ensifer sp. 2YAB10]|uniref:hypothetical protein n=1 Tax=unclassified Ensifer TaxID=2633371 RepID=UPI003F8EDE27
MSPTTNSKVLLPHEINQIEQIFVDVLRGLGLSRNSEAAEAIARRIISCYQGGTRESGALKHMIGYYKSAALNHTLAQTKAEAINRWENEGGAIARLPFERSSKTDMARAPLHS